MTLSRPGASWATNAPAAEAAIGAASRSLRVIFILFTADPQFIVAQAFVPYALSGLPVAQVEPRQSDSIVLKARLMQSSISQVRTWGPVRSAVSRFGGFRFGNRGEV